MNQVSVEMSDIHAHDDRWIVAECLGDDWPPCFAPQSTCRNVCADAARRSAAAGKARRSALASIFARVNFRLQLTAADKFLKVADDGAAGDVEFARQR